MLKPVLSRHAGIYTQGHTVLYLFPIIFTVVVRSHYIDIDMYRPTVQPLVHSSAPLIHKLIVLHLSVHRPIYTDYSDKTNRASSLHTVQI